MARANRHYIPGYVWHITHRCHKKEFLLKFVRDRRRWMDWLFEAKKRYNLSVLNYMVTSNHIHLLVYDNNGRDVIPKSIQLIAARTGQEYNIRKQSPKAKGQVFILHMAIFDTAFKTSILLILSKVKTRHFCFLPFPQKNYLTSSYGAIIMYMYITIGRML